MTSYNHAEFLRESIDSVLNQTYPEFELIIWDDASSDDSWFIINSYSDPRIRTIRNNTNQRWVANINKAISEVSTGEYIAIHTSDDIWEPEKLQKQVDFLDAHPQFGAVFTNAQTIDENGKRFKDKSHFYYKIFSQPNRSRYEWLNFFFYKGNALCHPSVLIRRKCHDDCGLYRNGFNQIDDFDMWVRLCLKYEIHVIPEKLVRFRVQSNEINTSGNRPDTRIRWQFEMLQVLEDYLKIPTYEELVKIFPAAQKYYRQDSCDIGYVLSMVALETTNDNPLFCLFGIKLLFDAINDPDRARKINQLYGFSQKDFITLTAKYDVFSTELKPYLYSQLSEKEQAVQTLTAQVVEKEQDVQSLSNQVAEWEQAVQSLSNQLVEREQAVQSLSNQIVDKEQQAAALQEQLAEGEQKAVDLQELLFKQGESTKALQTRLVAQEKKFKDVQAKAVEHGQQIKGLTTQLTEREQQVSSISMHKTSLQQELTGLKDHLNQREQILQDLNNNLLEIYSSTAWKIIQLMWKVRLWLAPKGTKRERFGRSLIRTLKNGYDFTRHSNPNAKVDQNLPVKIEASETNFQPMLVNDYENIRLPRRNQAIEKFLSYTHEQYPHNNHISHFILLPLFSTGGAELVALNFAHSIIEARIDSSILFIITDFNIIDHNYEIPNNVIFLNLNEFLNTSDRLEKKIFIYDLINTIKPSVIHNINSSVMWELIIERGNEIRNISKLFANIFCMQFDNTGNKIGYAESYLRAAIPYLDGLISDNQRFINDAINEYKLNNESSKFHILYTPTRVISEKEFTIIGKRLDNYDNRIKKSEQLRCIWAGRLDYQKRWDLFISIVRKCSFCEFDMYGKSVVDEDPILPNLPNLNFHGSYQSGSDVFLQNDYDVFIFTSQWEGLPTILLEAGIYGIPIIAPSVGGVGELVNNDTGYVLSEKPTIDDYVDALLSIKNNPQEAARRAKNMINFIHERYSWSGFIHGVNKLVGYLE